MSTRQATLAALLAYVALALAQLAPVLGDPVRRLPYPALIDDRVRGRYLDRADQALDVFLMARNARLWVSRPWDLAGPGQCAPLSRPHTLGEHLFGEGLLMAPFLSVTGNPILAYNATLVWTMVVPALAMYALALSCTGSAAAAFVAGLLFGFQPLRIVDPTHPSVHGDYWSPLVVLFAARLFATARWRDAVWLALFGLLTLLESLYAVLATVLLLTVLVPFLVRHERRNLRRVLPKLGALAAVGIGAAALVFGPYLATRRAFGLLQGRQPLAFVPADFLRPGGRAFLGMVLLGLVAIGLADRLRRVRPWLGFDPRVGFLCAGLFVLWCVVWAVHVPLVGLALPSPLLAIRDVVPGLDAVRALPAVGMGVNLAACVLAAYGALVLLEALSGWRRAAAVAALAGLAVAEVGLSPLARFSFGATRRLHAYEVPAGGDYLAALRDLPAGAVLDLPYGDDPYAELVSNPHYLLDAARHGRPVAACYDSFGNPLGPDVQWRVDGFVGRLDELYALGFRVVVVHDELLAPGWAEAIASALADPSRLRQVAAVGSHRVLQLDSPRAVSEGWEPLAEGAALGGPPLGDML